MRGFRFAGSQPHAKDEWSSEVVRNKKRPRKRHHDADKVEKTRRENNLSPGSVIPADLVLASASGLDPDISMEAALLQIPRVARERGVSEDVLRHLIEDMAQGQHSGMQPRINLLGLNMATDRLPQAKGPG